MGIASVKMELLALGGFKFSVVAVYLNSLTSLTALELQNAVNSLGGQRCIGSGAMESTYPTYSGSLQPFSFTTESGYEVEFTVNYSDRFRPRPENRICLFDFYVRKENQGIVQSNHSYGFDGGNPWVEFSPAIMFISPSGKIAIPDVYGTFGYYNNSDDNLACYLDGSYYVSPINPNAPINGSQGYGRGFVEIDVEYSDIPIVSPSGTPYGGEPSGPGGGDGPHDLIHNPIDFPDIPTISASDGGFISIWTPRIDQVRRLANYLWTTDIWSDAFWKKLTQNPLDLIFGLQIMPVPIYHTDETGPQAEGEYLAADDYLIFGGKNTRIRMDYIAEQFVEVDMGSVNLDEYWKAYFDYAPYTKISISLPYIGVKELNTNDCMNKEISLKYRIDLASGTCVALIKCGDSIFYQHGGNCATSVPVSAVQMQELIRNSITTVVAVAAGAAASASGAGALAVGASKAAVAASAAKTVMSEPEYHRSGSLGSAVGMLSVQRPYLIISRPNLCMPEEQQKYTGFPAFITENLDELTGYTEVEVVHLHNAKTRMDTN